MKSSLFDHIPDILPEEMICVLAEGEKARIERIVSDGHASPEGFWYNQEQDEWVLLISGSAVLSMEMESGVEPVEMKPGDYLLIPARRRHRVESTSSTEKTIWLTVFFNHEVHEK